MVMMVNYVMVVMRVMMTRWTTGLLLLLVALVLLLDKLQLVIALPLHISFSFVFVRPRFFTSHILVAIIGNIRNHSGSAHPSIVGFYSCVCRRR